MELRWSKKSGTWEVDLKISFGGKPTDIVQNIRGVTVTDKVVSFVDPKGPNGGIVKYQAVLNGDAMTGIAEFLVKDQSIYGIGRWESPQAEALGDVGCGGRETSVFAIE